MRKMEMEEPELEYVYCKREHELTSPGTHQQVQKAQ